MAHPRTEALFWINACPRITTEIYTQVSIRHLQQIHAACHPGANNHLDRDDDTLQILDAVLADNNADDTVMSKEELLAALKEEVDLRTARTATAWLLVNPLLATARDRVTRRAYPWIYVHDRTPRRHRSSVGGCRG